MENDEEKFLLKWNNHQTNLICVFKDWLRDESFVDVTLVCGGEALASHKVVLAACSPLLSEILHNNPCQHPVLILNDVSLDDMKSILKFIYEGEVSVSQNELANFLRTAENLQIKGLAYEGEKETKKRKEPFDLANCEHNVSDKKSKSICSKSFAQSSKINNRINPDSSSQVSSKQSFSNAVTPSSCPQSTLRNANVSILNNQLNLSSSSSNEYNQIQQSVNSEYGSCENKMTVKTEPVEYLGEMTWDDGRSITNKRSEDRDHCLSTSTNTDGSSAHQNSDVAAVSYEEIPSLDWLGTGTDFLQKNEEIFHSGKTKHDDLKHVSSGNEEFIPSVLPNLDEATEEDLLNLCSPSKFRGGRKPCYFCGKTFCDNYTLRRHMVTHLSRQRQFECSLCSAAYSRKDHLMAHIRRKHPDAEVEIVPRNT